MDGVRRFLFLLTIAVLGEHYYSNGAALDPFPLGTIGCLVSDVCDNGEICTNDLLFGSCQSVFSRALQGEPRFALTSSQIEQLERQITALIQAGFTWKDAYTQCTLQNTLVGFKHRRSRTVRSYRQRHLCEDALGVVGTWVEETPDSSENVEEATEEAINSEIASVLLRLLSSADALDGERAAEVERGLESRDPLVADGQDEAGPGGSGNDVATTSSSRMMEKLLGSSQKRDEIVQVHKYFDKSKGTWKRDPYFRGYGVEEDTEPGPEGEYPLSYVSSGREKEQDTINDVLKSIRRQSGGNERYPVYGPVFSGDAGYLSDDGGSDNDGALLWDEVAPDDDLGDREDALLEEPGVVDEIRETVTNGPKLEEEELLKTETSDLGDLINGLVLSPEDERVLAALLDGSVLPQDLENDQQKRLKAFIQVLIGILENGDENISEVPNEPLLIDDLGANDAIIPYGDDSAADAFMEGESSNPATSELELPEPGGGETENIEILPENFEEPVDVAGDSGEPFDAVDPALAVDKKMTDDDGGVEDAGADASRKPVDPHSMYLQLSEPMDPPTALQFVKNLSEIIHFPPELVYEVRVEPDGSINLILNDDPDGVWDAEKLATEAKNAKDQLKNRTGITVERAGFGEYGNRIELKQNNRYIVLTFILVGTIAGVVLAVVTIYLIKRHSRYRHKIQQLATNPDGNEASKDYQDLCRQRMQGKTSEKPEPLHAASRIGSVSEAQVRSPSSRSSTSSWSEEPAATNMDISTGHIVLSYMEDHLKNQDRLDREWDAVSGYVADPCSTRMAQDQANMRKNRFADILPYDHSRVILSSNANVSNSDYINASFITDHDPRNPAYICTQGPLPHTVADFWQMIWEQGSVVIVMLTKLSESGTSLCHRYWPEEGSDLYHIYEVHLVSEHIWCDDYLVRSFYLKNLQTNETRTVTQFHFLTWPELSVPASIKATLDFRRKVNKSFRGRSCPIVVHCSDGCGRAGTYCLIDMVLNKMAKGAKEIDMAATLEHIRDQRMSMVKTKEQFQFSLAAVAEEVHAILKALPQ